MVGHERCQGRANLVLIHGWGYDNSCWPATLVGQLERHFNVMLLTLPGHGSAPAQLVDAVGSDDCVGQLDAWLEITKAQLPQRYHVVGWSLGGQVAIRLAHNNDHVDRLILLATNAKFVGDDDGHRGVGLDVLEQFVESYGARPGKTMSRFASLQALGCEQSKTLTTHMVALMAPAPSKLMGLKLLHRLDEREHLTALAIPCLIELADDDQLVPKEWVEGLALSETTKVNITAGGHGYVLQSECLALRIIAFLTAAKPSLVVPL